MADSSAGSYGAAITPGIYGSRSGAYGDAVPNVGPAYGSRAVDAAGEEPLSSDRDMATVGAPPPAGAYAPTLDAPMPAMDAPMPAMDMDAPMPAKSMDTPTPAMDAPMPAMDTEMEAPMAAEMEEPMDTEDVAAAEEPEVPASKPRGKSADAPGQKVKMANMEKNAEKKAAKAAATVAKKEADMTKAMERTMHLVPDVDAAAPWAAKATAVPCIGETVARHGKCAGVEGKGRGDFLVRKPCENAADLCMVKNGFHAQCVSQSRYERKVRQGWSGEVLACPKA